MRGVFRIWAILGLLAMIVIWFLPWRFQTNDDELMMWLVSGAYTGTPESYAVFIHPLLSWVFSKLYTLFPEIRWYPLSWFGVMYLGYLVFLDFVWKKNSRHLSLHIWTLFLFAFLIHFSFFLQFSIVSAFAVGAGICARILRWNSSKFLLTFFITDILILFGFLIRVEVPFLILTGLLVLNLILGQRRIFRATLILLPLLIIFFGLTQLGTHQMGLGEFQKLNKLRSQVFDHPILQLRKDDFKEPDPSLYHFANGLIDYQKDDLTIKKLSLWKEKLDSVQLELYHPTWLGKSFWNDLEDEWFLIGLMFTFLFFTIFLFRWKAIFLFSSLFLIALILSPFFLLKVQVYAILFLTFFSANFLIPKNNYRVNLKLLFPIALLLIFGILNHFKSFFESKANLISSEILNEKLLELQQQGFERIYLIGSGEILRDYRFEKKLPFKILGWYTFLEGNSNSYEPSKIAYLVDELTFYSNSGYFERFSRPTLIMEDFILLVKE